MAQDLDPSSYCELKVFSKKQRWGLTCLIKKFCLGSSAEPVFHTAQSLFSDLVLRLFSEALHVGTWHLNNLSPSSTSHSSLSPREVTLWRAEWREASSTTSLNLSSVLWVVPLSCLSCFHFPNSRRSDKRGSLSGNWGTVHMGMRMWAGIAEHVSVLMKDRLCLHTPEGPTASLARLYVS